MFTLQHSQIETENKFQLVEENINYESFVLQLGLSRSGQTVEEKALVGQSTHGMHTISIIGEKVFNMHELP